MSKFQYYSTKQLVNLFIEQGKEGECWDFKQEWHKDISTLIKDIVCFANTVHDENCYIIFGISDDLKVTGMKCERRKQADIIDAISNLHFAGDNYPKISVETIIYEEIKIDVLTIYNTDNTPIYLKKTYGKMREGSIYLRIEDKNTPDNSNADIDDIENLWKKRLGLTKTPLNYIYDRMHNKLEWMESNNYFYNKFKPEYIIEIVEEEYDEIDRDEFYSYAMINKSTSFKILNIKYQQTIIDTYQITVLDGGRLRIPVPEWGFICSDEYGINNKYSYKYYILGTRHYRLLMFLLDKENYEELNAFKRLQRVVLLYFSESERLSFEEYLETNQEIVENEINSAKQYDYIKARDEDETKVYKENLTVGVALNNLLKEWRKDQR